MELSNLEKQMRIERMEGFRAIIEVDLKDEGTRAPYRKIYNDYINGFISRQEFSQKLNKILSSEKSSGKNPAIKDEIELHLSSEEADAFLKEKFSK